MKNLFSVNCTGLKSGDLSGTYDRNPYLTAEVSDETRRKMKEAFSQADTPQETRQPSEEEVQIRKKARFSLLMSVILLALAFLSYALFLKSDQLGDNFLVGLIPSIPLILALVCSFRSQKFRRQLLTSETSSDHFDMEAAVRAFTEAAGKAAEEMHIPDKTDSADIFPLYYKEKNGREISCDKKDHFDNFTASVYLRDGAVCFATVEAVFTVPLSDVVGYRFYDQPYTLRTWLKSSASDSADYARFHITKSGLAGRHGKGFYGIEIGRETGLHYEILIPNYDFPVIQKLIPIRSLDGADE